VTAAQIEAMGYEAGVWDLLGTVHVARKALASITNLNPTAPQAAGADASFLGAEPAAVSWAP
jgi:hypothetical protein